MSSSSEACDLSKPSIVRYADGGGRFPIPLREEFSAGALDEVAGAGMVEVVVEVAMMSESS